MFSRLIAVALAASVLAFGQVGAAPSVAQAAFSPASPAQQQSTDTSHNQAARLGPRLQSILDEQRLSINIPGANATVAFADGSRWSGRSGVADVGVQLNTTTQTSFVMGSITKTYVGTLIMKLAEEGRLSVDDKLSRWLPNYPNAAGITLRQLLSHTSGLYNYFSHPDYESLVFGRPAYHWTPNEILTTFARDPYFTPGAGYRYSNTNYVVLGLVAEAAGGASLSELVRSRIFVPLGANRSFMQTGGPATNAAKGYLLKTDGTWRDVNDNSGYRPSRSAATVAYGAGDGSASADDVATFIHELYGGSLLNSSSVAEMTDWERYVGGGNYGLASQTRTLDSRRMFGHTGSLRGFVASAWHVPSENTTVVVMTNRGRISSTPINDEMMRAIFTADTTAPTTPSNFRATSTTNSINLAWSASTDNVGVAGYRLSRNGSLIATLAASATSFTNTGLAPDTSHNYSLVAFDAAGNVSGAASLTASTQAAVDTTPSVPTGPAALVQSDRSVRLTWNASTGGSGTISYRVFRNGSAIATKTTNLFLSDKPAAGTHSYQVRAIDASGNKSALSSPVSAVVPSATAPSVPTGLTARTSAGRYVHLSWNASTGGSGQLRYRVFRNGSAIGVKTASLTLTDRPSSVGTFHYQVRAIDASGNKSALSPAINVANRR